MNQILLSFSFHNSAFAIQPDVYGAGNPTGCFVKLGRIDERSRQFADSVRDSFFNLAYARGEKQHFSRPFTKQRAALPLAQDAEARRKAKQRFRSNTNPRISPVHEATRCVAVHSRHGVHKEKEVGVVVNQRIAFLRVSVPP